MIHNQVRHRLRHELNVQLTDSNVIETPYEAITQSRINKHQIESNSDMSIIHELGMLDSLEDNEWKNESIDYFSRNNTILKEEYRNQSRHYDDKRNSPFTLKNKIKSFRQQLQVQNQYRNGNRFTEVRSRGVQMKTPPRTYQQNTKNFIKPFKDHNEIADIEQKISILPYQLQQKIKQNLQKKITALSKQEHYDNSPIKSSQYLMPEFSKMNQSPVQEQIYNQNTNFIPPLDDKSVYNHNSNKQKFVSLNRQPILSPKNTKQSIIFPSQNPQLKQKYSTPHLNLNQNNRRQKSASRQNILWNSIQLKQNPSSVLKVHSRSKQKQHSLNKNNKIAEMIEKRKHQFSQFYNQQTKSPTKEFNLKENMFEISEQFNKSKIIKYYTQILSSIPKCKRCSNSYGALTLFNKTVIYACNQCDLKNKLERSVSFLSSSSGDDGFLSFKYNLEKQISHFNHPIVGALFDIQNKLMNETQMKTYNALLKQISTQLQKIQETKRKLTNLQNQIEDLKKKVRSNPKCIFEAKNSLKKLFSPEFNNNNTTKFKDEQRLKSIDKILPPEYFQQLDLWCKIKAQNFTQWPSIDQKLQILCPLYMKRNIKTIRQFLDPLLHNFENNDVKISVSEGLKLPVKSLGSATFIVDGSYNISAFDHIQRLTLQFLNKRTFRQITSMMQNLPQTVQQLKVNYNHKLNSHISAQKYPILTKLASIRSCKKLFVTIQNCKDEDDLISAMKVMTKKRQLKIFTTRSIYVRKPVTQATNEIKEMIKRLGKNIYHVQLSLSVDFDQVQIYKELMLTQRNKLMNFSLCSTASNEHQLKPNQAVTHTKQGDNLMNVYSILNQIDHNHKKSSEGFMDSSFQNNKNLAKQCFLRKQRKKLSTLAVLKQSFNEKEVLQKYQAEQNVNIKSLSKKHISNHDIRLEVLKMLL